MEPELEDKIKKWESEYSQEELELIYIRQSAKKAFEEGKIKEVTAGFFKAQIENVFVCEMSKEHIGALIGKLDKFRHLLAALTQGYAQGYTADEQPKAEARRRAREKKAKAEGKKQSKSAEREQAEKIMELARSGALDFSKVKPPETEKKVTKADKVKCDKCGKEVYSLKFHSC